MAGCLPEYFPVVVAVLRPWPKNPSTSGSTASRLRTVIGRERSGCDEIGTNAGVNLFGPGNRANATIGRAVRLIILNIFRMTSASQINQPKATQENTVFVLRACRQNTVAMSQRRAGLSSRGQLCDGVRRWRVRRRRKPRRTICRAILETIADAMANCGCISIGQSAVILSPEHAEIIANSDFSKSAVREFLFEHASRSEETLRRIGKFSAREYALQERQACHRGLSADDILLVVGGGDAGGHSSFIPSWSRSRASMMQSEAIGVCIDC